MKDTENKISDDGKTVESVELEGVLTDKFKKQVKDLKQAYIILKDNLQINATTNSKAKLNMKDSIASDINKSKTNYFSLIIDKARYNEIFETSFKIELLSKTINIDCSYYDDKAINLILEDLILFVKEYLMLTITNEDNIIKADFSNCIIEIICYVFLSKKIVSEMNKEEILSILADFTKNLFDLLFNKDIKTINDNVYSNNPEIFNCIFNSIIDLIDDSENTEVYFKRTFSLLQELSNKKDCLDFDLLKLIFINVSLRNQSIFKVKDIKDLAIDFDIITYLSLLFVNKEDKRNQETNNTKMISIESMREYVILETRFALNYLIESYKKIIKENSTNIINNSINEQLKGFLNEISCFYIKNKEDKANFNNILESLLNTYSFYFFNLKNKEDNSNNFSDFYLFNNEILLIIDLIGNSIDFDDKSKEIFYDTTKSILMMLINNIINSSVKLNANNKIIEIINTQVEFTTYSKGFFQLVKNKKFISDYLVIQEVLNCFDSHIIKSNESNFRSFFQVIIKELYEEIEAKDTDCFSSINGFLVLDNSYSKKLNNESLTYKNDKNNENINTHAHLLVLREVFSNYLNYFKIISLKLINHENFKIKRYVLDLFFEEVIKYCNDKTNKESHLSNISNYLIEYIITEIIIPILNSSKNLISENELLQTKCSFTIMLERYFKHILDLYISEKDFNINDHSQSELSEQIKDFNRAYIKYLNLTNCIFNNVKNIKIISLFIKILYTKEKEIFRILIKLKCNNIFESLYFKDCSNVIDNQSRVELFISTQYQFLINFYSHLSLYSKALYESYLLYTQYIIFSHDFPISNKADIDKMNYIINFLINSFYIKADNDNVIKNEFLTKHIPLNILIYSSNINNEDTDQNKYDYSKLLSNVLSTINLSESYTKHIDEFSSLIIRKLLEINYHEYRLSQVSIPKQILNTHYHESFHDQITKSLCAFSQNLYNNSAYQKSNDEISNASSLGNSNKLNSCQVKDYINVSITIKIFKVFIHSNFELLDKILLYFLEKMIPNITLEIIDLINTLNYQNNKDFNINNIAYTYIENILLLLQKVIQKIEIKYQEKIFNESKLKIIYAKYDMFIQEFQILQNKLISTELSLHSNNNNNFKMYYMIALFYKNITVEFETNKPILQSVSENSKTILINLLEYYFTQAEIENFNKYEEYFVLICKIMSLEVNKTNFEEYSIDSVIDQRENECLSLLFSNINCDLLENNTQSSVNCVLTIISLLSQLILKKLSSQFEIERKKENSENLLIDKAKCVLDIFVNLETIVIKIISTSNNNKESFSTSSLYSVISILLNWYVIKLMKYAKDLIFIKNFISKICILNDKRSSYLIKSISDVFSDILITYKDNDCRYIIIDIILTLTKIKEFKGDNSIITQLKPQLLYKCYNYNNKDVLNSLYSENVHETEDDLILNSIYCSGFYPRFLIMNSLQNLFEINNSKDFTYSLCNDIMISINEESFSRSELQFTYTHRNKLRLCQLYLFIISLLTVDNLNKNNDFDNLDIYLIHSEIIELSKKMNLNTVNAYLNLIAIDYYTQREGDFLAYIDLFLNEDYNQNTTVNAIIVASQVTMNIFYNLMIYKISDGDYYFLHFDSSKVIFEKDIFEKIINKLLCFTLNNNCIIRGISQYQLYRIMSYLKFIEENIIKLKSYKDNDIKEVENNSTTVENQDEVFIKKKLNFFAFKNKEEYYIENNEIDFKEFIPCLDSLKTLECYKHVEMLYLTVFSNTKLGSFFNNYKLNSFINFTSCIEFDYENIKVKMNSNELIKKIFLTNYDETLGEIIPIDFVENFKKLSNEFITIDNENYSNPNVSWKKYFDFVVSNNKSNKEDNRDLNKEMNPQDSLIPIKNDDIFNDITNYQFKYSPTNINKSRLDVIVVGNLIEKIPNLGGLARTCEVFNIGSFVINSASILKDTQFQGAAASADKWLPITVIQNNDLMEFLKAYKLIGYSLVGIEQTKKSVELTEFKFFEKIILIMGNEKTGLPQDIIDILDHAIVIKQHGKIRSLNVHVCSSIVINEISKQLN